MREKIDVKDVRVGDWVRVLGYGSDKTGRAMGYGGQFFREVLEYRDGCAIIDEHGPVLIHPHQIVSAERELKDQRVLKDRRVRQVGLAPGMLVDVDGYASDGYVGNQYFDTSTSGRGLTLVRYCLGNIWEFKNRLGENRRITEPCLKIHERRVSDRRKVKE